MVFNLIVSASMLWCNQMSEYKNILCLLHQKYFQWCRTKSLCIPFSSSALHAQSLHRRKCEAHIQIDIFIVDLCAFLEHILIYLYLKIKSLFLSLWIGFHFCRARQSGDINKVNLSRKVHVFFLFFDYRNYF